MIYNKDAGNVIDAGLLQGAIWFFQGQAPNPASAAAGYQDNSSNPFVQAAFTAAGSESAAESNANGAFGVSVITVNDFDRNPAQDLLDVITPIPDGGTTIALLGFAFFVVERLRQKLAR